MRTAVAWIYGLSQLRMLTLLVLLRLCRALSKFPTDYREFYRALSSCTLGDISNRMLVPEGFWPHLMKHRARRRVALQQNSADRTTFAAGFSEFRTLHRLRWR